jgi:hypothetical protein
MIDINQSDIDALWDYIDGDAKEYFGMSYADGVRAMLEWVTGDALRPDQEEE